jgi:Tfp pilus assembly protein PilF
MMASLYMEEIKRAMRLQKEGMLMPSAELLRKILTRDANHFQANYLLGMNYHQAEQNDRAIPFLCRAVEQRPDNFAAVLNLGIIQREAGMLAEAQHMLEKAVSIRPDSATAHVTLGMLLMDRSDLDGAVSEVEQGLCLDPDNPQNQAKLGLLMQIRGEPEKAARCYRKVISFNPLDGTAHRSLAFVQRYTDYNDDIRQMEAAIHSPNVSHHDQMLLGYALGKVFDDLGQFDRGFEYLHSANQLQRQTFSYSIDKQRQFFERHKHGLDRKLLEHCKDHVINDQTPIFVVGMPRSGTSLVEQILASHPQVWGAGEVEYSRFFVELVERTTQQPFPVDIRKVPPMELRSAGRDYIEKISLNSGSAERVVDKLPHNFLRVGLFAAILPQAKIILCDRDPRDNCLSIYQHFFGKAHGYASNLSDLGEYYGLYQDLMGWWETILPGHMHRISYEQLVSDTESEVRRLLEYCELPFDQNCLSFHKTLRHVQTPSASQVRQPVYQNSIGRWKNYEKHLQPLCQALGV